MENRQRIGIGLSLILFIGLSFIVKISEGPLGFDLKIMDKLGPRLGGLSFMKAVTNLGGAPIVIGLGILVFIIAYKKSRPDLMYLMVNSVAFSFILNYLLKILIRRQRPLEYMLVDQSGYSFPSGHSMVSMSFYLTIAYIISRAYEESRAIKALSYGFYPLIALIGVSRVYLGVHWPSDVLGGFLLGYCVYLFGLYKKP